MKDTFPIRILTPANAEYPHNLQQIPGKPKQLYVRGTLPPPGMPLIGVVGTRECSPYGLQVTQEISSGLAANGVGIVSGLALGIDGAAHRATLAAGGYTLAVLGTGIDDNTVYPAAHRKLALQILETGGALVSEYTPGARSTNYSFQMRNRIIAGLSVGTLVTEAPQKSGALITAKYAVDYNRELFIAPHNITNEKGAGGNGYLRLGARAITSYHDILIDLHVTETDTATEREDPTDETQKKIYSLLGRQPLAINDIIKLSGLPSAVVMSALTMLEIGKFVKNSGGMQYTKTKR